MHVSVRHLARRQIISPLLAIVLAAVVFMISTRGQNIPTPPGAVALDTSAVRESSGLARSRLRDELLWTHNDSGDSPRLFAFTRDGRMQAALTVDGAAAIDWEDMCTFTRDGTNYIAVADVGDNRQSRRHVTIYVCKEPPVPCSSEDSAARPASLTTAVQHEIRVHYPNGPANCEALAYDPWREEFVLATKESLRSRIFSVGFDTTRAQQQATARLIGNVILPMVTGASISDDGQLLALATYGPTCLLRRPERIDWSTADDAQRRQATWQSRQQDELELIPAPPRRQGEAVCFDRGDQQLLMTSEGAPMLLFKCELTAASGPEE